MRKIALLVGAVALLTMLFAGVAFARNFQCTGKPCYGTDNPDTIFERGGEGIGDIIYGMRGADTIYANRFGADADTLYGGRGSDYLDADDGDGRDTLNGGLGVDTCNGDATDTFISCEHVLINGVPV
jgi:hypothetical protein